jgi:glycosyltransferase involved in cell wall biosynthesis
MKILYINKNMHIKNNNSLLNYKNINLYIVDNTEILNNIDLTQFNAIYSPSIPINVSNYPNTKFLFGPHFSVFPEKNQMDLIRGNNVTYIQPSEWVVKLWKNNPYCNNIKVMTLAFGVDTEKFKDIKPISERNKVVIYFKHRNPIELQIVEKFLQFKNINYCIFSYKNRYSENEYLDYLQNSKFGIWVDAHESQGFALEEALSCNVPLLVWNVTSMNQEYGSNYNDISATTIPYWDEKCGEYFYNNNELENTFNTFLSKIESYKPREYILQNLSIEKCEQKLIDIII